MLYQIIVAVCLVGFAINVVLNLRALRTLRKPGDDSKLPEPAPFVSVLIPARNEEENIVVCLESLQKQDYPNFEILVLDDNSTDRTAELVSQIATKDDRIRLIRGEPLPEGWAGKPFACYQLAEKATGSWLLFVDADTTSAASMLQSVIALALELKPSLLSGFPRQLANSLPEKIAMPVLYFVITSWMPLWWLHRSREPKPSLAIGQFLLFPRDEYWRIGGHKVVSSRILEDVWLGVEVVRHGGRHIAVDLSPVFSTRMYRDIGGMWEGFVKWIYSVAALSRAALIGLIIAGGIFYLAPFYWLWNAYFSLFAPTEWRFVVAFQVALILFMRWLVDSRLKQPLISTFLHPIGFSFLFAAGLYGAWREVVHQGVRWKGRTYDEVSGVE
ncbi:MAG: glycosyltransferase [Chloroflexi bacterium]|nr:glycosyltransferase [Chloroflexota bacterium]MBM3174374.1 glycosyltransferase [Chloroflexota bacterium]